MPMTQGKFPTRTTHERRTTVSAHAPHAVRTPHGLGRAGERAFSLIEVIIALVIVSVVMSGAALAVVSSDSAEGRAKAVADVHAMGEKAVERLRTDLTAQSSCDAGGWIATARAKKLSAQNTQTNFAACQVDYNDLRDSKGRGYLVSLIVRPRDNDQDGLGAADSDGDLRDTYDVQTTVRLAADSRAGREETEDIQLGGTVDWEGGSADDATVTVVACAIDRPDRALIAGGCTTGDPSRRPVTVPVNALRIDEQTGGSVNAGTITSGGTPTAMRPAAYRFSAPATISSGGANFTLFKLDPADLRIAGSQAYTLQATYVRASMTTTVCTQINNYTGPHDDGYEVLRTNLHVRRANQAGSRTNRIVMNNNRSWNCTGTVVAGDPNPGESPGPDHTLSDPIDGTNLYRGLYDIEIDQINRANPGLVPKLYRGMAGCTPARCYSGQIAALRVSGATLNCSLPAWNQALNGTPLASRGSAGALERPSTPSNNTASLTTTFKARMGITANTGGQRLCIRFNSKQFDRQECQPGQAGCIFQTCGLPETHKGMPVIDDDNNCANGAEVCVANCSAGAGPAAGTVSNTEGETENAGLTGGPVDGTVACTTQPDYAWPGTRRFGDWNTPDLGQATINSTRWIGGDSYYYANYSGRALASHSHPYPKAPGYLQYPENPVYHCADVYFTATRDLLLGEYPLYTCLEAYVPGRPNLKIRGLVLDQSGTSGGILYTTVGGALGLAPDSPRMQEHWNPQGNWQQVLTGSIAWPKFRVRKVNGDPVCNSGGGPVFEHVDPIITYWRVYDDARIDRLAPQPVLSRLGTDLLGV